MRIESVYSSMKDINFVAVFKDNGEFVQSFNTRYEAELFIKANQ